VRPLACVQSLSVKGVHPNNAQGFSGKHDSR